MFIEVVTRYGGHKHLASSYGSLWSNRQRQYTLCAGTSSWTVEEWATSEDHPFLKSFEMKDLPECDQCKEMLRFRE